MILVTGAAGFVGYHTIRALIAQGETVVGVDNLNDYYDVSLKQTRLEDLKKLNGFTFYKADIAERNTIEKIFSAHPEIDRIIHLAAQAGVRYSLENPYVYGESNLTGHLVMLEAARALGSRCKHFVYASSSSVYGGNTKTPFSVKDEVNSPVSLYAATKRAGELMAQSYAHLYHIPATGLRFFTVYGPIGRPDMAYFSFTKNIVEGRPIKIFNHGKMRRDFTWIDDIVAGILAALETPPKPGDLHCIHDAPHRVFNLGNNQSESLLDFVETVEKALGKSAQKEMCEMMPGDVVETYADIDATYEVLGYRPRTPISVGIPKFVEWYKSYYGV